MGCSAMDRKNGLLVLLAMGIIVSEKVTRA